MQPRCPECGVARGDEHTPDCSRHDVEYDPIDVVDPFWGTLGLGAESKGASAPVSGWYPSGAPKRKRRQRFRCYMCSYICIPRWAWWFIVLALILNLLRMGVQFMVDHTGPNPAARPCMIQIQGFDRGDSGTWVKLYPEDFDCPPVSQWPVLIMRTPPPTKNT
jgi:hypothetical protein